LPGTASQVPIIALTASAFREDRDESELAGMDDFLSKPVQSWELIAKCVAWAKASSDLSFKETLKEAALRRPEDGGQNYSVDFLRSLMEIFLETAPPVFQNLLAALENKNWVEAKESAHWLQGGAARILDPALQQGLGQMEKACLNEDLAVSSANVESLKAEFDAACKNAESWLLDRSFSTIA